MNIRQKNFICNGLAWGIGFFLISLLLCYYTLNQSLQKSLLSSLVAALLMFVVNGFIQSRFTKSYRRLSALAISLGDNENVKLAAPANHIIDDHLISGKLFLTGHRLVFISFDNEEY